MKTYKEPIHLCPVCTCVEMEFLERVPNKTTMRTRRFKCPICDHTEMYLMSGPHDKDRQDDKKSFAAYKKKIEPIVANRVNYGD